MPIDLAIRYPTLLVVLHAARILTLLCRHLLGNFRMVGEAQAVDRIIEKFAARWIEDNPDSIFTSADAAYMFAYAIIMLATDLHRYFSPLPTSFRRQHQTLSYLFCLVF